MRLLQVLFFNLLITYHLSFIMNKSELESTFIEIVNLKKLNIIVGIIYRNSSMGLTDFNICCLSKLLENISKEQISVFLLGDFNVDLLNFNEHNQTNEFLDSLTSSSFLPLILQIIRTSSHSNTIIDIFSNFMDLDIILGTICDHLPEFAIIPKMFSNISGNKSKIYERDWLKYNRENFILDYFSFDLEDLLKVNELNSDNSIQMIKLIFC